MLQQERKTQETKTDDPHFLLTVFPRVVSVTQMLKHPTDSHINLLSPTCWNSFYPAFFQGRKQTQN